MDHSIWNKIKLLVFDVDGVFTNSSLLVTESGELLRTMNVKDGQAVKFALNAGFEIAVITRGNSTGVRRRLTGLGIKRLFDAVDDKMKVLSSILDDINVTSGDVLYMGDDIPDIKVMRAVGLACAPGDAVPEAIAVADFVSHHSGGKGAVRDVIRRVMTVQGKWPGN